MADFKELIEEISNAINAFAAQIPNIEKEMLDELMVLVQQMEVKNGRIKIAAANIRLLAKIKAKMEAIVLNPTYVKSVGEYVKAFDSVVTIQNNYFNTISDKFTPPKLTEQIKEQAIEGVVAQLTESGIAANVSDKIAELIRQPTTSGGSYTNLTKELEDFVTGSKEKEEGGQLSKYTKQITTDAINQFAGQYTQIISSDLGFEWFRYSGSNIETTRAWCLACTEKKYFHISEMPKVLKGEFSEFKKYNGKISRSTGLPAGLYENTDVTNFITLAGGYNCGHKWRPVSEDMVPEELRNKKAVQDAIRMDEESFKSKYHSLKERS